MVTETLTIPDLADDEQGILNLLWSQLRSKQARNLLRSAYYDGKNAVQHLGISLPENCKKLAIVLGWSAKAVDVLNDRCVLDGFVTTGGDLESLGFRELWDDNMLDVEAPQLGVSSLIHATAFLVAHQGDVQSGEPAALVTAKDGTSGTGVWDRRRRVLTSFLSIIDTDDHGRPTDLVLYLPNLTVSCRRDGVAWTVDRREHSFGVPVEPIVHRPRLARPFGTSRISRPVMSLHDSAIRTALRSEVTAELYSVPQRVLLGAGEDAFKDADGNVIPKWQFVMGRIWGLPDDENASNPRADVKEFSSANQDPHVAQLRAWAQLFAGETSIPVSSLGMSTEANPASAEAYYASREDLIKAAESTTDGWSPGWRRTMVRALQMWNGLDPAAPAPDVLAKMRPKWRNPATPSRAAAADAGAKTIAQFPWLAETPLGMELYGLDQEFIDRAWSEKRRVEGQRSLAAVLAAAERGQAVVSGADAGTAPQ